MLVTIARLDKPLYIVGLATSIMSITYSLSRQIYTSVLLAFVWDCPTMSVGNSTTRPGQAG